MKTIINFLLVAVASISIYSCSAQQPKVDVKKAFFVDVRTPGEFAEGSAKDAVNIPLNEVAQRLEEFKGKPQIVVFCRSGNRSSQAEAILKQNGFTNVINGGTWQIVDKMVKDQIGK